MSGRLLKLKNVKKIMILEIVILFLFVLFFSPRKAFSELISGDYTVGEERYKVTMSRNIKSVVYKYNSFNNQKFQSRIYVNYLDEDGNSFDFSTLTDDIEYDCNGSTCNISYNEESVKMFNEKLGYINIQHGSTADLVSEVVIPKKITYKSIDYNLDYYYASYGCNYSYYFSRTYDVKLNGESIEHNRYVLNPLTQYYSDKIEVDETDDMLDFYWEYYTNKITINLDDRSGENLAEHVSLRLISYSPGYEDPYNYTFSVYGGLDLGSYVFELSSNFSYQGYFTFNDYSFMVHVGDKQNIAYDTIPYFRSTDSYKRFEIYPSDLESSITLVLEKIVPPVYIENNTLREVGGDKEFGYTITLDEKLNGNYFGIDYVDGVGKIYIQPERGKYVYFTKNNIGYSIIPDLYDDYVCDDEFIGVSGADSSATFDSTYRFSSENEIYYYGTVVGLNELVPGKSYVVFRATGGVGYLFTGKGNAKEMVRYGTTAGSKVIWPNSGDAYSNVLWTYTGTPDNALLESFGAVNTYLTVGKSTSGNRPVGNEISYVKLETTSSPAIRVSNDGYYLALNSTKDKYTSSTSANSLYFAEIDEDIYKVKFSGSNDGVHIYDGTVDKEYSVISGDEIVVPGIDSVKSPEKYNYVLDSWVEINTGYFISPGDTLKVNGDYEFYANWVPKTYDVGVNTDTVDSVDTNEFIITDIFDYNDLFNLYSSAYKDARWSLVNKGSKNHFGVESLGLVLFDNAKNSKAGLLNSVDGRDRNNASKQVDNGPSYYDGIVTTGLSSYAVDRLFDTSGNTVGVNYVGEGNYLYQYDEKTGFYYYDSRKNAASYNESKERFYVYDYVYGTSKSMVEGENGADFLPFNYMKKSDALKGKSFSSSNGATNYWFGLKSEINFVLPDDVGVVENGTYGNKAVNGNDMILKFSGDDDVWIFVDDKLVLDLGGAHDIVYGEINFSTGVVTTAHNGALINTDSIGEIGYDETEINDSTKIVQTKLTGITAGAHTATFYYVERGASRSNVSLYFNISDKYDDPGALIIERNEESYASFEKHEFSLELSDTSINGQFGDVLFNNGVTKFKLLGGEKIKVIGLPAGIKYKIKVFAPVEHTTEFNSNGVVYETREVLGKIIGGNTSEVQYKNNYDEYNDNSNDIIIPETKDDILNYKIMLFISLFISLISVILYTKINKKKVAVVGVNNIEEIEILTEE